MRRGSTFLRKGTPPDPFSKNFGKRSNRIILKMIDFQKFTHLVFLSYSVISSADISPFPSYL